MVNNKTKQNKKYNNENMMASDVYQWGKKRYDKINIFAMNVLKYGKKWKTKQDKKYEFDNPEFVALPSLHRYNSMWNY